MLTNQSKTPLVLGEEVYGDKARLSLYLTGKVM
jgi:hypothetical protein